MTTIRALAATGMLGTGFAERSLEEALAAKPDFIGCDAGSADPGPYYLGSGQMQAPRAAVKRDLRLMLGAARKLDIPLIIGSAGTAGADIHLRLVHDIIEEVASEDHLSFRLATIQAEQPREYVKTQLRRGRVRPLWPAEALQDDTLDRATRIVAQMGAEPIMKALESGADVVLAGRASDAAVFAALPLLRGASPGPVWHAAKVLECGAASAEQRLHPDCMMAWIGREHFTIQPPNRAMRCSPTSVAAHTLYENSDPFELYEPSGMLDTSQAEYAADGRRGVRVSGSRFVPAASYTVRLEAAELVGYRSIAIAGIRDPLVLRRLDATLNDMRRRIEEKAAESLGIRLNADAQLLMRVYGHNGVLGSWEYLPPDREREVCLVLECIAGSQEVARSVVSVAWHTALHHPIPESAGLTSNLAFPFSPPELDAGPVYRFTLNHLMQLDDPCEPFPTRFTSISSSRSDGR